jgi:hypothetical protein
MNGFDMHPSQTVKEGVFVFQHRVLKGCVTQTREADKQYADELDKA